MLFAAAAHVDYSDESPILLCSSCVRTLEAMALRAAGVRSRGSVAEGATDGTAKGARPRPCEVCGEPFHANASPFKADGRQYAWVCGGCKIRLTLTPARKAALETELSHALSVVAGKGESPK
jgi:hypothetical protein